MKNVCFKDITIHSLISDTLNGSVYYAGFEDREIVLKFCNPEEFEIYELLYHYNKGLIPLGKTEYKSRTALLLPKADSDLSRFLEKFFENSGLSLPSLKKTAEVLDLLHNEGFIHRDVHPGNIFGFGTEWYLADFGLCRKYASYETDSSHGVIRYASLGQLAGRKETPADDLYSFLLILNVLEQRKRPWDTVENEAPLLLRKMSDAVPVCSDWFKEKFDYVLGGGFEKFSAVELTEDFMEYMSVK